MHLRRDAGQACMAFFTAVNLAFRKVLGPDSEAVWTVGQMKFEPGGQRPAYATLTCTSLCRLSHSDPSLVPRAAVYPTACTSLCPLSSTPS